MGTLSNYLVIQGSTGSPNRHLEVQVSIFIGFRMHLGSLLGATLENVLSFCVIWGAQVRDSFQVHLCDDLGVEMLSESGGCMCLSHNENFVV